MLSNGAMVRAMPTLRPIAIVLLLAALPGPAGGQPKDDLTDPELERMQACARVYAPASPQWRTCVDLPLMQEVFARVHAWAKRFGLNPTSPDFDVELEAAARQRIPYALILDKCLIGNDRKPDAVSACLAFEEKVFNKMGVPLDKPPR